MNHKPPPKSPPASQLDSLALYRHTIYDFEGKLRHLLSILEQPKELHLAERFKKIETVLDNTFRLELLYRLHLMPSATPSHAETTSDNHHIHPQILLHVWCLLGCTDSVEYIAHDLGLTFEEVQELIRELHHTFSIDPLASQVRQYYEKNKRQKEIPEIQQKNEFLGIEHALKPQETTEDRKRRLRKKYGHLAKDFEVI
jgi:hypothetical protein